MKGVNRFTNRMLAVMLSGALMVGNMSVFAFAADNVADFNTIPETATEEQEMKTATEESLVTGSTETGYINKEETSTSDTGAEIAGEDTPISPANETNALIASFTITLDANGGYFENEWDDVLGEYIGKTETLNKVIPVGGTVSTFPFIEQDSFAKFLGWSLERDGELVWQESEEGIEGEKKGYVPSENCILYAVWRYEDIAEDGEGSADTTNSYVSESYEMLANGSIDIPETAEQEKIDTEEINIQDDNTLDESPTNAYLSKSDEMVKEESTSNYDAEKSNEADIEEAYIQDNNTENNPLENDTEDHVTSYTITLDANGGFFENEWDDVLGKNVDHSEILNKVIPFGKNVNVIPVRGEGDAAVFLGWSLQKNGELISVGDDEYVPVDNCVLYAVWQAEDASIREIGSQSVINESCSQIGVAEESRKIEASKGPETFDTNLDKLEMSMQSESIEENINKKEGFKTSLDNDLEQKEVIISDSCVDETVSIEKTNSHPLQTDAEWFLGKRFIGIGFDEYISFFKKDGTVYAHWYRGGGFLEWKFYVNSNIDNDYNKWGEPWEKGPQRFSQLIPWDIVADGFCGLRARDIGGSSFQAREWDEDPIWGKSWNISMAYNTGPIFINDKFILIDSNDNEDDGVLNLKNLYCTGKVGDTIDVVASMTTKNPEISVDSYVKDKTVAEIGNIRVNTAELTGGYYHRITATLTCISKGETNFIIKADDKSTTGTIQVKLNPNWSTSDEWSFENYSTTGRKISLEMQKELLKDVDQKSEKKRIKTLITKKHDGQCAGFAVSSMLVKLGELSLSEISNGLKKLKDAKRNNKSESIIGYYYLSQYTDMTKEIEQNHSNMTPRMIYESLIHTPTPYYLSFRGGNTGGHAVVATGIESGKWSFHGHSYDIRILTYDSNFPMSDNSNEDRYLYLNQRDYNWEFPYKFYYDTCGFSSYKGGWICEICHDPSPLKNVNLRRDLNRSIVRVEGKDSVLLQIGSDLYDVSNNECTDLYYSFCDIGVLINNAITPNSNIIINKADNIGIIPCNYSFSSDSSITVASGTYYYEVEGSNSGINTSPDGNILIKDSVGEFACSITSDNPISNSVWSTIDVSGKDMGDYSCEWTNEGVIISADDLSSATITFSDGEEISASVEPVLSSNSIIIYEEDGNILYRDTDKGHTKTVSGIKLDKSNVSMAKNELLQLSANVIPEDASDKKIIWTSGDTNVAIVSSSGLVRAVGVGTSLITAETRTGGFKKTCLVSVGKEPPKIPVTGIMFSQENFSLNVGESRQLEAHVIPDNASDKSVIWTSDNTSIATITTSGKVLAISPGSAKISVKSVEGGYIKSCVLNVNDDKLKISNCTINLSSATYTFDGNEKKPYVKASYSGKSLVEGIDYIVDYKNNVYAGTGVCSVTGIGRFTGNIEKTFVIEKADYDFTVTPWTNSLGVGQTTYYKIRGGIGVISFSSSNPKVADIDSDGWIEGVGNGTTTFTVTAAGDSNHKTKQTSFDITVNTVYQVESDSCGDNATWTYYSDGTVKITGFGKVEPKRRADGSYLWDRFYNNRFYPKVHTVVVEDGITSIEEETFTERNNTGGYMSDSPQTIIIGDSVTSVGRYAFYHCNSLERIKIGSGLLSIGDYAFSFCPSLSEIIVSEDNKIFTDINGTLFSKDYSTIYKVPHDNRASLVIPQGVTTLKRDSFGDLESLQSITIPNTIISIEQEAFDGSDALRNVFYNGSQKDWGTITIGGNNDSLRRATMHFAVTEKSIVDASITGIGTKTYTGKAIILSPIVKIDSATLKLNSDYTISYKNNTNAGTATVIITGKGNYTGVKKATFKINKAAQSITVKNTASSIAVGKTATISIKGAKSTTSYKSSNTGIATVNSKGVVTAKKVGTVKITATSSATSNYNAAFKTVSIKVVPKATSSITATNQATGIKLTWKKVTGATGYKVYRGSTLIKTIKSGSTVTCTDTKANTNGTKYIFNIIPIASTGNGIAKNATAYRVAKPAVKTVKNSSPRKMTVTWEKNSKATGYQIQYSMSKTFANGNKTATVTKAATVSKVIGSLTKGKTYYVRIRANKTVGKTRYWSAWSATKTVKIRK